MNFRLKGRNVAYLGVAVVAVIVLVALAFGGRSANAAEGAPAAIERAAG